MLVIVPRRHLGGVRSDTFPFSRRAIVLRSKYKPHKHTQLLIKMPFEKEFEFEVANFLKLAFVGQYVTDQVRREKFTIAMKRVIDENEGIVGKMVERVKKGTQYDVMNFVENNFEVLPLGLRSHMVNE